MTALSEIEVGFQVYSSEGGEEFGAVRAVQKGSLTVYVENGGDYFVPEGAVRSVHDGKVVVDAMKLGADLRRAIKHAHDRETD